MADIFGKDDTFQGTSLTTADLATLRTGQGSTAGKEYLLQNVSIQYNQPIQVIKEIGSGNSYLLPSRSQGTCRISRIVGASSMDAVLGPFGKDIWTSGAKDAKGGRTITVSSSNKSFSYTLSGCIVESFSLGIDANGNMCQEDVSIRFCGLAEAGSGNGSSGEKKK